MEKLEEMDLESAIELLRKTVKRSEALDRARHFDLTLLPAEDRLKGFSALKRVQLALRNKEVTQEYIEKKTTLKTL